MSRPRVAFVVQRCGEEVVGGAERLCLDSARAMRDEWSCTILTTCARESATWANTYEPGQAKIDGIDALRFSVENPRVPAAFDRASQRVARGVAEREEQIAWMRAQGPYADGLFEHLRSAGATYDAVFFFSYLYATTYFGLPHVRDRAIVVPLAHDEWMLRIPIAREIFTSDVRFAFVSEEERLLVETRFGSLPSDILDVAIAIPSEPPAATFAERFGIGDPFVLYVGRVDAAKGVDDLIRDFATLYRSGGTALRLVLVGPISLDIPADAGVLALGRVSEADKWAALEGCRFVMVPSKFESLSLATLEAWAAGRAVLVNGASAVLVGQCRRANAGLWYATSEEFARLTASELFGSANALGENGRRFVRERCTPERARDSLRASFAGLQKPPASA